MTAPAQPLEAQHGRDPDGVDRDQIRAMLELTPAERLRRVEEFVQSILEIRELNEKRPVR